MGDQSHPQPRGETRARLLTVIAIVLVIAALKLSKPVSLPLAGAVFLIILVWPVQAWLEDRAPRWLALLVTVTAVLLAVAVTAGALVWTVSQVAERAPQLAQRLDQLQDQLVAWARARGLPTPDGLDAPGVAARLGPLVSAAARSTYAAAVLIGLMLALLALGLLEVRDFEARVLHRLRPRFGDELVSTLGAIAGQVRRYMVALTLTCAVSGAATSLFALVVGLELAATWGLVAFVLNYIPNIGPAIAVVPPTLFALLRFEGLARPLVVFVGMGAIQFFIGNFVDPKIQGRALSLSPAAVLFAVVFWGWVWGVLGAFLAVPLTAALLIGCQHVPSMRWLPALLTDARGGGRTGRER